MRTRFPISVQHRPGEQGFAVLALMMMLFIMLSLVAANTRTANWLRREVNLVERQQIVRLAATATNRPPAAVAITNQVPVP